MLGKHRQLAVAAVVIGLGAGVVAPAVAFDTGPTRQVAAADGGLLDGLLTGEGGLLGPRGLLGSEGGLLPSLLGQHSTPEEFAEGTGELIDDMGFLAGDMVDLVTSPGTDPVGGDRVGEGNRGIAGGLLGGVLGGLLGRS